NVKPESFQKFPDYIIGLAEMDDGFRALAWVKCDDYRKLRRNMRIRIEIGEREEDGVLTYFIVPAD
ncbi:MAG: 3-hydroxybutyryl-CoA epimerase, partial [Thaumarchaeota archaeon]|nr:3-hydroxybutyryl-CoA epimerase [Nitrososphaerota archaeon]